MLLVAIMNSIEDSFSCKNLNLEVKLHSLNGILREEIGKNRVIR